MSRCQYAEVGYLKIFLSMMFSFLGFFLPVKKQDNQDFEQIFILYIKNIKYIYQVQQKFACIMGFGKENLYLSHLLVKLYINSISLSNAHTIYILMYTVFRLCRISIQKNK